jgi:hypothetical protein
MQIFVKVDAADALESLEELGLTKKGPRILANTLNEIAKKVQSALQADMADNLKIKRTAFIHNAVKIEKGSWAVRRRE